VRSGTLSIGGNAANGTLTVPLSGTGSIPIAGVAMPLLSPGLPIYASSSTFPANYANDAAYATEWRSVGVPATLTVDLSGVPAAQRQSIWLVWYNDDTASFDHPLIGALGYNNVGAYTLSANAAAGGGTPPTSGWVQLASLTGNTLHSYGNNVNFAGYNWIQYSFTASDGTTGNSDIALNLDIYGSSNGVTDGWFFAGDSITQYTMSHGSITAEDENNPGNDITIAAPSFGQMVNAIIGTDTPLQENAGIFGFTSGQMVPYLAGWLQNVPSKYVTIDLGTNDALQGVAPATFYANMQSLVQAVMAAGKVPVVPTIPYSTNATAIANTPALNAQIQALYAAYPAIVPGPDLYTYFKNNPQYLSSDQIDLNAQGSVAYRTLWAQFAAGTIY
jgi:hypothetical protein